MGGSNASMARSDAMDKSIDTDGDYFPTYHSLTQHLINNINFPKEESYLETSSGDSDIVKVFKKNDITGFYEIDIKPRNENVIKQNFLTQYDDNKKFDHIVTNPPYNLFLDFMVKSAKVARKSISNLLPLDYTHGQERYKRIYRNGINGFRLKFLLQFICRPLFDRNYDPSGKYPTGMRTFAWFYFEKDYSGEIIMKLIDNSIDTGKPNKILCPTCKDDQLFEGFES